MSFHQWFSETEEIAHFLPRFLRSPRVTIREQHLWSWPNILILQLSLSVISGVICGLFSGSFFDLIGNTILTPLQNFSMDVLLSAILYATLKFRFAIVPDDQRLFQTVVIAQIPLTLLHSLKAFDFPSTVVGLVFTMILLFEGIPAHLAVPKRAFKKWLLGIYGFFFALWLVSYATQIHEEFQFLKSVRPIENKLLTE